MVMKIADKHAAAHHMRFNWSNNDERKFTFTSQFYFQKYLFTNLSLRRPFKPKTWHICNDVFFLRLSIEVSLMNVHLG